ncbi:MAG: aminotransferase class IV [Bacteroidales bacterium]|nr:aminotransferase class IV [Bacteroidales bacterium]
MSRYIETIQLSQGTLMNLEFHQERFERTRTEALGLKVHPRLAEVLQVPRGLEQNTYKCRVIYEKEVLRIEYEAYHPHLVRSLRMVHSDSIQYPYKYENRSALEKLFRQRRDCDDILIVKNECITDSFYANVVFWDGKRWATSDTPLLPGTMRASLIKSGLIVESRITRGDLSGYRKLKLINAMNDLENAVEIPIDSIY